ncbi:hypothetical protein MIR68_009617 [Amoeboaphelidium protococcarum]|nr:hypothetical protein MIR68_009617 [Amoeboaphelidium protococcarum]
MVSTNFGTFTLPALDNEPVLAFAPGSNERAKLKQAIEQMKKQVPFRVPVVINGKEHSVSSGGNTVKQVVGCNHKMVLCEYSEASESMVRDAIEGALKAKESWELLPLNARQAIFLRAAKLLSSDKWRYRVMAATMLGQGKNVYQAEIDCIAELCDFWRFNNQYAAEIYAQQPPMNSDGIWNRVEYRPLEGFVLAVSPFNFTAIGGNLPSAPALMGNVCVWKPSPGAMYSNYLIFQILKEAGMPDGVIQFVPGDAPLVVGECLKHREFSGLHFTGSTHVFKKLWKDIAMNMDVYRSYPRIVGETGGKNMHMVHPSADPEHVVINTIRAAFEYQGQKCSACSRLYAPKSLWPKMKELLVREVDGLKVGPVDDFENFITNVVNEQAFDKVASYIDHAKTAKDAEVLCGGKYDKSVGYFIHPTVIVTTNPHFKSMEEEIFGPVLTVYVYEDAEFEVVCALADSTSPYGLTASIFAKDRRDIQRAVYLLRNSAGNFYINDKCTGAVVGQQPFGGARGSGTNDKAGAALNLYRWVSARSIKENYTDATCVTYPSNAKE